MKHTSARSLYNTIGQKYHDNREKASNDVTELPVVLQLLGNLKGKDVLDMGCGLGKHAQEFLKRGATVTGYDASEKMVKLTEAQCKGKGTFFRATHETVNFKPTSFDVCNASLSINYSKDLDLLFKKVNTWLKSDGVFTFSLPHPVWLATRSNLMDFSYPHKIWIKMKHYDVEVFNYYYPLDTYIQLINKYHFSLLNLIETTIPRRYKGWPEDKHRLPNTLVFKVAKR